MLSGPPPVPDFGTLTPLTSSSLRRNFPPTAFSNSGLVVGQGVVEDYEADALVEER